MSTESKKGSLVKLDGDAEHPQASGSASATPEQIAETAAGRGIVRSSELSEDQLEAVAGGAASHLSKIEGQATAARHAHEDQMEVLSFSWGETQ
jgi:hypothetical protein